MVTSRSVLQQTAQIFSPLAGQKRAALRFSEMGQDKESPKSMRTIQQNTLGCGKRQRAEREGSGHDDFVVEAAGGDEKKNGAHGVEGQAVEPQMREAGAAQDDAAGDVDVIACGDEKADDVEERGHGLSREKVAGKEDSWEKGEEGELDGLGLGVGFAGDENADGKRNEKIGERKERENQYVAVNGNLKDEAHESENQTEFGKTDREIG